MTENIGASASAEHATDDIKATQDFTTFNLPQPLVELLLQRGILNPTAVQIQAIPLVCNRQNLIVQAKTGTGKTFAFGLPLLALLNAPSGDKPRALVVAPTRELALQVYRDLEEFGALLGLRTVAVYGGADISQQITSLRKGVDIVVGTPGRLLDLANQKALRLESVEHVVLDEADEMLDMGFLPDITKLLHFAENRSQTLLFSATMPTEIRQLARRFAPNPYFIQVADPEDAGFSVAKVNQLIYRTHPLDKPEVLARLLQADGRGPSIVFTRTKRWAQRLSEEMNERGFNTAALHGDLSQIARERALEAFREAKTDVLIATDVAARGIDIDGITHVVNYDAPEDAASYLHRIGRTARAGRSGTAVTFVDIEVLPRWVFIARELGIDTDPAETYSTSAHLFSDLSVPAGTKGRLTTTTATPQRSGSPDTSNRTQRVRRSPSGRGQREQQEPRRLSGSAPRPDSGVRTPSQNRNSTERTPDQTSTTREGTEHQGGHLGNEIREGARRTRRRRRGGNHG